MYHSIHTNIFYISKFFFIIHFYTSCVHTRPQGEVRIVLDSLLNSYATKQNNECCSGSTDSSKCNQPCNMFVSICINPGIEENVNIQSCLMGTQVTRTFIGNEISFRLPSKNLSEPVYEELVQSVAKLKRVEEQDALVYRIDHTRLDEVYFRLLIRIFHTSENYRPVMISENIAQISFYPHNVWRKNQTNNKYGPNLKYSYHIQCDPDYGSSACGYHCIERRNWFGHYDCNEEKKFICHPGWTGELCHFAICEPSCVNGWCLSPDHCSCMNGWKGKSCDKCIVSDGCLHGSCTSADECNCSDGWTGKQCTQCIPSPTCIHGTCQSAFECNCDAGWTGHNCNEKITCEMNPCENQGICKQNANNYTCLCPEGLSGINCELDTKDHCQPFPCTKDEAVCIDKPLGYECQCPPGWGGSNCSEIDMCSLQPCINSHECNNVGHDYYCSCKHGWTGKNCTENANDCQGQCQNNATCIDKVNEYSCECQPGYFGKNCQKNIDECASSPCHYRGICVDKVNEYECICQTGYEGKHCSSTIDLCTKDPCLNKGKCLSFHNDYKCTCTDGWTGRNCEISHDSSSHDTNECKINPCRHGSTCYMLAERPKCHCSPGYTGKFCQINIENCLNNVCQNSGTCIDRVNSYECVCPPGFEGQLCEKNVDNCLSNPCQNGGNCTDGINAYLCDCPIGYKGHDCSYNINDCKNVVCENGGKCVDGINSYSCQCREGFMGKHCDLESDQCLKKPCSHGKCLLLEGGHACVCDLGFTGQFCNEEINECIGVVCENGANCIDKVGYFECNCSQAFHGSNCQHINACIKNPCGERGRCLKEGDGYQCKCKPGYFGTHCKKLEDSCMVAIYNTITRTSLLMPRGLCGKHGDCVVLNETDFKCRCHQGWTGDYCNIDINFCENNLCRNSGTCIQGKDGYECLCQTDFTGKYCELSIRKCDQQPCENSGLCIDLPNDFNCSCINGWKGKTCTSKFNNCENSPCLNGGRCTDLGSTFKCDCLDGFVGSTCAKPKDYCTEKSCLNGGTCMSMNETFVCLCLPGFTGDQCESGVDHCSPNPCQNNALCKSTASTFQCFCQQGFVGMHCEYVVDQCSSSPCSQDSYCQSFIGDYRCICPEGKFGRHCEESAVDSRSCIHQNKTYKENEIWRSNCNKCRCIRGRVKCNQVDCGPKNCFKELNSNCVCQEKVDIDCITPPCPRWGECVSFKTSSIHKGGCNPSMKTPNLNSDCSTLNINFEKVGLPTGMMTEKICEEFRYSDVLQDPLNKHQIILSCQRHTNNANINELVISVFAKDRAVAVSLVLAEYYKYDTRCGTMLNKLNRTTSRVYVRRHTDVKFIQPRKLNILVPIISGLIVFSLVLLFVICLFRGIRERIHGNHKNEVSFTQKQNHFQTKSSSELPMKDESPVEESTSSKHKCKNNKKLNFKYEPRSVTSDRLSTINEFVPDKVYISDTNNKFSSNC